MVRASQFSGSDFGLGGYNRAVHYVAHIKTVLESKQVLANLDEFLSRILLDDPLIQSDFERLLVDVDVLRRTAYKLLGEGSKDLIFGLLDFVIYYRKQVGILSSQ